jgi:hypothetical protein
MRKSGLALAFALGLTLVLGGNVALGCGDKFVLLGRGTRFTHAKYPSRVLIYMRAGSRVEIVEKKFHLEAVLKAAGHRPTVVESAEDVRPALQSQQFQIVLADITDVQELRKESASCAEKPSVIPILYEPTAQEIAQAERDASCLARPSSKSRDLIGVIDETMANRQKGIATTCAPP